MFKWSAFVESLTVQHEALPPDLRNSKFFPLFHPTTGCCFRCNLPCGKVGSKTWMSNSGSDIKWFQIATDHFIQLLFLIKAFKSEMKRLYILKQGLSLRWPLTWQLLDVQTSSPLPLCLPARFIRLEKDSTAGRHWQGKTHSGPIAGGDWCTSQWGYSWHSF